MTSGRKLLNDMLKFGSTVGLTTSDPLIVASKIGLFKGSPNITVDTVIGDLTEADYDGYAQQALGTLGVQYQDANGAEQRDAALKTFIPTGATTPNVITGWFLTDTSGAFFLGGEYLDQPKVMASVADHLPIVVSVALAANVVLGQSTVVG